MPKQLVDSDDKDWYTIFKDTTFNGQSFAITKTRWENMIVSSELSGRVVVNVKKSEVGRYVSSD
jgi:hypothetical protein